MSATGWSSGPALRLACLPPRLRGAGARRIVALTHGHEVWWARTPGASSLLRRIGDSVDVVTYVSEWCRDRIAPALSVDAAERMERLSPGVDPQRFYPGCGGADVRKRLGIDLGRSRCRLHCPIRSTQGSGHSREGLAGRPYKSSRRRGCCSWETVLTARRVQRLASSRGLVESVVFAGSVLVERSTGTRRCWGRVCNAV